MRRFPSAFPGMFGRFFETKIKLNIHLSANEFQMGYKTVAKCLFFAFVQAIKLICTELSMSVKERKGEEGRDREKIWLLTIKKIYARNVVLWPFFQPGT